MGSKCKSNQSPARYSVAVEKDRDRGGIGVPGDAELTKGTYHSRGKKIRRDRRERLVLSWDHALPCSGFHFWAGLTR